MSELNLSNISCEYFYDEEYDLEEPSFSNNLYSSNTTSNNNNNNNMSFGDQSRDSEFWAESILQASGNNNITNSYMFEKNFRTITKCLSSDQMMDNSYLNDTPRDGNYQLFFENSKVNMFDSNENIKFENVKRHLFRKGGSKFFVDSGKGSATTCDSMVPPTKFRARNIIKSEEYISEVSIKRSTLKKYKKRSVTLWREFKRIFSEYRMKWSKVSHSEMNVFSRSYSMPTLTVYNKPFYDNDPSNMTNRYSTTILEVYNYSLNFSKNFADNNFYSSQSVRNSSDFSSQFPEDRYEKLEDPTPVKPVKCRKKKRMFKLPRVVDYPRLGKILMPMGLRTPISEMFKDDKMCGKLEFLGRVPNIKRSQSSTGRSLKEVAAIFPNENPFKRSNSESRQNPQPSQYHNQSNHGINRPQPIIIQNQFLTPVVEEVVRSVSFADLRPIPRRKATVAVNCDDDIMAIFNVPTVSNDTQPINTTGDGRKDSVNIIQAITIPEFNSEEELNHRIAGLVNSTLESIKRLSIALNDVMDDLGTLCDKFVRCKDSRRDSTVTLMTVVDSILALISDGLCVTNKKPRTSLGKITANKNRAAMSEEDESIKEKRKRGQITQKLWIFVEESCRGAIKEPSQKMALGAMMKQVKQIQIAGSNREFMYQMRLQLFITVAIKKGLLSIWLRAVVTNESILNRFFSPNSFLRQARTVLSNALAAVIVEIRNLCTNNLANNHVTTKHHTLKKGDKQGASRVTKPVSIRSGRSRQIRTAPSHPLPNHQSSNNSSQNNRSVAVGIQRRTRNNNSSGHRSQSKPINSTSRDRMSSANQNVSRGGSKSRIPVFIG